MTQQNIWKRVQELNKQIEEARTWFLADEINYHEYCALADECQAEQKQLIQYLDTEQFEA